MLPVSAERSVTTQGLMTGTTFGISQKNQAHILSILRDRLYTNKILAVLREYSSNAWDAHIDAGKADVPIKVNLPTQIEPTLFIRDYGKGLSEEEVYEIYAKYGESTKRTTNSMVGMLGIGSKSAFAYSDSFTVTSFHGGMKKVFVAVLDASDMGVINKLYEEACNESETGIEIRLPVRPSDVPEFQRTAENFFRYFSPVPDINIKLEKQEATYFNSGFIRNPRNRYSSNGDGNDWTAVMGCVPYRLNLYSISGKVEKDKEQFILTLMTHRGGLYLEIGDADVSANREELEYTDRTISAIVAAAEALVSEIRATYVALAATKSGIEKYRALRNFRKETNFPYPSQLEKYLGTSVPLYENNADGAPGVSALYYGLSAFRDWQNRISASWVASFDFEENPKLVINDLPSRLVSQRLQRDPIVLICPHIPSALYERDPVTGRDKMKEDGKLIPRFPCAGTYGLPTADELKALLRAHLIAMELPEIEIVLASSLPEFVDNQKERKQEINVKHRKKAFVLGTRTPASYERSSGWEPATRDPEASDPVFLIDRFVPVSLERKRLVGAFDRVGQDRYILQQLFGYKMPDVYGVKITKNTKDYSEVAGTYYYKWVIDKFRELLAADPVAQKTLNALFWTGLHGGLVHHARHSTVILAALADILPEDHALVDFFVKMKAGFNLQTPLRAYSDRIRKLAGLAKTDDEPTRVWEGLRKRYPMMQRFEPYELGEAFAADPETWGRYIRMEDLCAEMNKLYEVPEEPTPAPEEEADVAVDAGEPTTTTAPDPGADDEDDDNE